MRNLGNSTGTGIRIVGWGLVASAMAASLSACGTAQGGTQGTEVEAATSATPASEGTAWEPVDTSAATVSTPAVSSLDETPATTAVAAEETAVPAIAQSDDGGGSDKVTVDGMIADGVVDIGDLFTQRDLKQTADLSGAKAIALASGQDVRISEEGTYVLSGSAAETTVYVEAADDAKVQLVLDGVNIENSSRPAICVLSADKVFVTTAEGSENSLSVTGTLPDDVDAALFSKDDLTLNGTGTLRISSTADGVSCKDDLRVTGGSYEVSATGHAFDANDSLAVSAGSFLVTAQKDGFHAEVSDDDTVGLVYVCGGTFDVHAGSDGLQATTFLQIDGGTLSIETAEGLEATYVQVNGGSVAISTSDDGINATTKSASLGTPTIEIRGGDVAIDMAQGDTDALDVNGNLIVSGGSVAITGQSAFDFDGTSSFTGGTITVNGSQVSEIQNSMMGGGMMGGRGMQQGGMAGGQGTQPGGPMQGGRGGFSA